MKKVISFILVFLLTIQSSAFAGCNFTTDIKDNVDGTYTYSRSCHIEVGKKVKELELRLLEVDELKKTITFKDLALQKQEERISLWMNAASDQHDKLLKYDAAAKKSDTLYFLSGIAVTILSVWAAGQLVKR